MDKIPNLTTPDEPIKEKRKFTATIVDTTDLMKDQATDVGNEKMTMEVASEELQKLGGWKNLGKRMAKAEYWSRAGQKLWKYGLKRNYNLNKEIYKASQEILKSENVFVGEDKGKDVNDKVMTDIIDQFNSGYEETIHKEAGEKKAILGKDELEEEATGDKEATKQLIMDWVTGKIDRASFKAQEERLFHQLKGNQDDKEVNENVMYASNLFQVAEQVKLAFQNGEFLENEDFEFDVIYGKSKAGVRTEEHFNKTERIMNKLLTSKVGQFTNETTLAIALSCISTLAVRSVVSLPGKIVPILGTALISSWFAKKRGEMDAIRKRNDALRKNAQGKFGDLKEMPVRAEMLSTNYKTESANDLIKNIDDNLKILEIEGKNLTEQELNSIFWELARLEALILLSDRRRIDLVTYSDSTKVVEERKSLDINRRLIKDALRKEFEKKGVNIPNGLDFDKYLNSLATTEENRMINEENTGIDAKDRDFNKIKIEKGKTAAKWGLVTGVVGGVVAQELMAGLDGIWGGQRIGIGEDLIHQIKGDHVVSAAVGTENLTMVAYLKHLMQGDLPKVGSGNMHEVLVGENHIKVPKGMNMVQNPDGTHDLVGSGGKVFGSHLTTNPDGTFTPEAKNILARNGVNMDSHLTDKTIHKSVSVDEHVKNASGMEDVHERHWMNNNTEVFDKNELRTQYGGINGTGFDAKGNVVLNLSRLTADGSYNGDLSVDAQELMKAGQLKMIFSMSDGTQNKVFEFTATTQGEIIIPADSECVKLMFPNVDGYADFQGRFGEVAQDMGNGNYMILGTMEGKGLKDVIDTIVSHNQETILRVHGGYDWTPPPFIPIVPGEPLETLKKEQKEKVEKAVLLGAIAAKEGASEEQKVIAEKAKEDAIRVNSVLLAAIKEQESKEDESLKNIKIAGIVESLKGSKVEKVKMVNEISKEEYDGMNDDIKMLNKKGQSNEGIVTLEKSDFKSEYGKKRYEELKHIKEGKNVTWNKDEVWIILGEMDKLLTNFNMTVYLEEKAKKQERDIFDEFKKFTEEHPTEKIPEEMEERYRKAEEELKLAQEKLILQQSKEENLKLDLSAGSIVEMSADGIRQLDKSEAENGTGKRLVGKEADINQIEITKAEIQKSFNDSKEKGVIVNQFGEIIRNNNITPSNNEQKVSSPSISSENMPKKERLFTKKDLSKIGTEFESEIGTYTVTKVSKNGFFSKTKIEVIYKDKNGKETTISYNKKELEGELKKGKIKINKVEEGK